MSHFVIACGGTGGHLAPGIALAERLQDRGHSTLLLISEKQIDAQLAQKYAKLRFAKIPGAPLLMDPAGVAKFLAGQTRGLIFSLRLIRRERPSAIVGFGGFTTAAIILAGWLTRVPVMLHEANQVPGRAVRTLAKFARRVYLPSGVTLPETNPAKIRHAGLPVRCEIERMPRHEAAEVFGIDPARITVGVLGGSQGAAALNQWAAKVGRELAKAGVATLAVTGPGKSESVAEVLVDGNGDEVKSVTISFCDNMAAFLSACDLVISRAGAGSLAEIVRCRVPAVLVPYPHAADAHQLENAAEFYRRGGGQVVLEQDLEKLLPTVLGIVLDENKLQQARANERAMSRLDTLQLMLADMEELAVERDATLPPSSRAIHP